MSADDRADLCLTLLLRCPEAERIACLQALQRLVQRELARLWAEQNESPGHVLREDG